MPPSASLRLSLRGAGFSALAAGLLAEGSLRSELGALLIGAGLAAAILLSLAGVLFEARRQRRALEADPEGLRPRVSQASRDGGEVLSAAFRVENLAVSLPKAPGTSAWAVVRMKSSGGRTARTAVGLPAPGSESAAALPASGALRRGVYRGRAWLAAGDAFGFWRSERVLPGELETAALPAPSPSRALAPKGGGGERSDLSELLVRGEDRFDSRPYLPGDDTRRIHWKLYARFGGLFVRPGDLSPPPRKTVRILLDTELPAWLGGEAGEAYLDSMVSSALGFAESLEDSGFRVLLSAPGMPDAPLEPGGRLYWLADLAWDDGFREIRDPGPEPLLVFGAPGSVRRGEFLAGRTARRQGTTLLVPDLPPAPDGVSLARLFLEAPREERTAPGRTVRTAFRTALDREGRPPSGEGGFDVHIV